MAEKHTVKEGECMATIAKKYGFKRWQTIYEAAENEEFCKKRPNPNVLYPGDEIVIPEKEQKEESGATEQKHRFRLNASKWIFRMEMKDEGMNPLEDYPFKLYIDDELVKEDKTKEGGLIECPIPEDARYGKLHILGEQLDLNFGGLDPISRIKGVQQRLNNLGYNCGVVDGICGKRTRQALYNFQKDQGLEITGEINDETRRCLIGLHDDDERMVDPEDEM